MLSKLLSPFTNKINRIPASRHGISDDLIEAAALQVIATLQGAGYSAYLVGGGLRDMLFGLEPKDFDVVSDARPEQIKALFRRAYIIGRRFRLVHVHIGRDVIEVCTFRNARAELEPQRKRGKELKAGIYGDIASDYQRRDLTMNALYYDPSSGELLDLSGGFEDICARRLRMIGNPKRRFREDPMRLLRCLRFAAKLDLSIDAELERAIRAHTRLLAELPGARLLDEYYKLFHYGHGQASMRQLQSYGLVAVLFPQLQYALHSDDSERARLTLELLDTALANTDERVVKNMGVSRVFLPAVMLWHPLQLSLAAEAESKENDHAEPEAFYDHVFAMQQLQNRLIRFPKHLSQRAARILRLQYKLIAPEDPFALTSLGDFRAAYDLLCLRAESGEPELKSMVAWWTRFQRSNSRAYRLKLCRQIGIGRSSRD